MHILFCLLAYLLSVRLVGVPLATASWRIYKAQSAHTLAAMFFFPFSGGGYFKLVYEEMFIFISRKEYLIAASLFWPLKLVWGIVGFTIVFSITYMVLIIDFIKTNRSINLMASTIFPFLRDKNSS